MLRKGTEREREREGERERERERRREREKERRCASNPLIGIFSEKIIFLNIPIIRGERGGATISKTCPP